MPTKRVGRPRKHSKSGSSCLDKYTALKETSTRKKVDLWLTNLGWNTDEESPNCNITTERALTHEQKQKLNGKEPDYFLYKSETKEIIATIETKAKGENLDQALKDAIKKYAEPLEVPLVFVTDGSFFRTWYRKNGQQLFLDGEPVNQLLSESVLLRFLAEGSSISFESPKVQYTRDQLISIFKWTDDKLRKEGLRQGVERFTEFANILFLKLISEIEDFNEKNGKPRRLDEKYCWESFHLLGKEQMKEYINGVVLPHLVDSYNHSGDVFQLRLGIKNATTLEAIVNKLDKLILINTDSDIKGDAFEYFLKDSITVGNDLGEYFTPRHIVRLMVDLMDPQFGEKIYDPTCGTGGFLIEAFKHVKRLCKQTTENVRILEYETVFGNELTNTARIAKQNMILIGDGHTNIEQKDSLEHPIKEKYDIVLANPPYGQETDWGHLYAVPSEKNADCVFVQHIMNALNEKGRAAVIVPEGFLFRTGVDKKVRELLLQNFNVETVISLPAGVFNPYTASKVNIIIFRKGEGSTKRVWFYDMHNDGFDLGSTRKPIPENDLPDLRAKLQEKPLSENSWWATYEQIKSEDYDLTVQPYNPHPIVGTSHEKPDTLLKDLIKTQISLLKELEKIKKDEFPEA